MPTRLLLQDILLSPDFSSNDTRAITRLTLHRLALPLRKGSVNTTQLQILAISHSLLTVTNSNEKDCKIGVTSLK